MGEAGRVWYGPEDWEGPAVVRGPVSRVAVLSDIHANVPALDAVLAEPDVADADLVVLCGDLTWGPEPQRTWELITGLGERAVCLRGNADRFARQLGSGARQPGSPRETWMREQHSPEVLAFLERLPFSVVVVVHGWGPVLFCHGSPRSDHELVTPGTPPSRFAELAAKLPGRTLVTGHTHLQFDRTVAGVRSIGPGSVGLPFHDGPPGTAYWALLGAAAQLRCTRYDAAEAAARTRAVGDPSAERIVELLERPLTPAAIIADAETRVFSD